MSSSRKSITDLVLHLHPKRVSAETLRLTLSWGLGGMATVLAGMLFITGVMLLLAYQPTIDQAYESVLVLTREIPFGRWVRNIHHWSANLLAAVAVLHMVRVVLTGGFGPGRRLNWVIGLVLLVLLLAANFTGYLLPWDQLAYWAVTICTSMLGYIPLCGHWLETLLRGGDEIGPATLANFFVLHAALLPGLMLILSLWHFWLVRRAGGLVRRKEDGPSDAVPTSPNLLMREAAVGLSLIAFVLVLAMVADAPLLEQANPGMSPNPAKAPWYFQGFQELLLHLHPTFAIFVWPLLAFLALICLPFARGTALTPGVWFGSHQGRLLAILAILAGAGLALSAILLDGLLLFSTPVNAANTWIARGLFPTVALIVLMAGAYVVLVRKLGYSRAEAVMAGVLAVLAVLIVCTVVGVWFRGPEMLLSWPWAQTGA